MSLQSNHHKQIQLAQISILHTVEDLNLCIVAQVLAKQTLLSHFLGYVSYNFDRQSQSSEWQVQESILPNFFLHKTKIFLFFAIKLGHFNEQTIFSYATYTQA